MKTDLDYLEECVTKYIDDHSDEKGVRMYIRYFENREYMGRFLDNCKMTKLIEDIQSESYLTIIKSYFFFCIGFSDDFIGHDYV